MNATNDTWTPQFSRWRHGGWYVHNVRYPSGACGCVSRNYPDKQWRIVCGRPEHETFSSRYDAALAERFIADALLTCPCGAVARPNDKFCQECGAPIAQA